MNGISAASVASKPTSHSRLPGRIRLFLIFLAGLTASFAWPLAALAIHAAGSELHSHLVLIPFVVAYLLYIRRRQLPKEYDSSPGWAIVALLVGLMALIAALHEEVFGRPLSENDYLALMTLSFVSLLVTGGFLFLGRKWMAAAAFPFAFLFFMIPLPDRAADLLETGLELGSAEAASVFFSMTGMAVLRDGTIFQLPTITLQVARECSGIRSSWVLLITSLLAANLFLKSPWRRLVLVAAVIPLGILRNGLRILFIGFLCVRIGPEMIHSIFHRRGGPPFFVLSLVPLFVLLWWLRRGEMIRNDEASRHALERPIKDNGTG